MSTLSARGMLSKCPSKDPPRISYIYVFVCIDGVYADNTLLVNLRVNLNVCNLFLLTVMEVILDLCSRWY